MHECTCNKPIPNLEGNMITCKICKGEINDAGRIDTKAILSKILTSEEIEENEKLYHEELCSEGFKQVSIGDVKTGDIIVRKGFIQGMDKDFNLVTTLDDEMVKIQFKDWRKQVGYYNKHVKITIEVIDESDLDKDEDMNAETSRHCGTCQHRKFIGIMGKPCITPKVCKKYSNWEQIKADVS